MIELKVLERYKDIELDRYVEEGETIEVSPERYAVLQAREKEIGRKIFEEVKDEAEILPTEKKATTRKATPSKK